MASPNPQLDDGFDRIEPILVEFEASWKRGDKPDLDHFLARVESCDRLAALRELILIDLDYRLKKGEKLHLGVYIQRYAELADAPTEFLDGLREYEDRLRKAIGPRPAGEAREADTIPQFIGEYQIIEKLNVRSGQADIFRAVHRDLKHFVIIKSPKRRPSQPFAKQADEQLVREGQILVKLDHPNIARIYGLMFISDVGTGESRPYLVMEYFAGETLAQYAKDHRLAPREIASIVAKIARALESAVGVLHLDVKPANIVLDDKHEPHLIDFGLARLCGAWTEDLPQEEISGTVPYMPPEQFNAKPEGFSSKTDAFSLGAVLYRLLTGHAPYNIGDTDVLERVSKCQWDRAALMKADAPKRLKAICHRVMAAKPEDRYSVTEVARELEAYLNRPRVIAITTALAMAGLAIGGGAWLALTRDDAPPDLSTTRLEVHIERPMAEGGTDLRPLINAGQVRTGDRLQLRATVPPGCHSCLLVVGSTGHKLLRSFLPSESQETFSYPEAGSGKLLPLIPPAGTEVFLLLVSRGEPPKLDEVFTAVRELKSVSTLPPDALLEVSTAGVEFRLRSKAVGDPVASAAQQGVFDTLEKLRKGLRGSIDAVFGVAFSHQP